MQLARRGSHWSLGHVNRDNGSLPTALFYAVHAAHRSGTHNFIIAPNPEVGEL
jgi:hypothetical protein